MELPIDHLVEIEKQYFEDFSNPQVVSEVHQKLSKLLNRIVSYNDGDGYRELPVFSGLKIDSDEERVFILLRSDLTESEQSDLTHFWSKIGEEHA